MISALLSDLQKREVTFDKKAILALWEERGYPRESLDSLVLRWFGVGSFALLRDGSLVSMLLSELEFRGPAFDPTRGPEWVTRQDTPSARPSWPGTDPFTRS